MVLSTYLIIQYGFTRIFYITFSSFVHECFCLFQNFVGVSISDGFIATGSETNEVCYIIFWFSLLDFAKMKKKKQNKS